MNIFNNVDTWKRERHSWQGTATSLGFVPTMGALHEGHISLIKQSQKENYKTLVSIFLNPTQFDKNDDFNNYPRSFEKDLSLLNELGVNYLFYPSYDELYQDNYRYSCRENELSKILCGANRTGHFDGVLTVVMKLLNIAEADRAYFGEKDYQQYLLIREMAQSFFLKTNIVSCPLIREKDGLALSSRNLRLSSAGRKKAPAFYRILSSTLSLKEIKKELIRVGFKVEYVEEFNNRRFGAVHLENVRLIDNVPHK
jgi:pantoate--beta-alanine ligase